MNDAPLPCVASVIVPVTKVVDIDQREFVIVDHVQLAVAVLPRSHPQAEGTAPIPTDG